MSNLESGILDQAERLLEERLGIRVRIESDESKSWDARLSLQSVESGEQAFLIEIKNRVSDQGWEAIRTKALRSEQQVLLVSPRLSPRIRERLRSVHINHVDLSGNIFIRTPGLYIWLDADRKPLPAPRFQDERTPNPFSKKGSLVLRALLEAPENSWGVRELSAETQLSLGHTSDIARALVNRGYAREEGDKIALRDPSRALKDWLALYDWKKNPRQSFLIPFSQAELLPKLRSALEPSGVSYALTLLAGAGLVAPHVHHDQTHVYIREPFFDLAADAVTRLLFGEPAPAGGNLHLMLPYYGEATFYGQRQLENLPVVSNVQLFLDLASYPLRGPEAARILVKGPLMRQLAMDKSQVNALTSAVE